MVNEQQVNDTIYAYPPLSFYRTSQTTNERTTQENCFAYNMSSRIEIVSNGVFFFTNERAKIYWPTEYTC